MGSIKSNFEKRARRYNSWIGGLVACIFVWLLFNFDPLPSLNGFEPAEEPFKSLIQWGLSRQLTHASLTLSALVGIFSMLRLRDNILQQRETQYAFTAFLAFLSYEYFKLIRSFQIVSLWESKLPDVYHAKDFLQHDFLQYILISANDNLIIFIQNIFFSFQLLGIAVIIFLLIRIYNHAKGSPPIETKVSST